MGAARRRQLRGRAERERFARVRRAAADERGDERQRARQREQE
ncbi:MAG TPA: hypothetical protein VLJ80_00765 [Solirubrobacteraceae bacterium]|nr:hypothetical protein [Solirubrobacteraceae bacterium]